MEKLPFELLDQIGLELDYPNVMNLCQTRSRFLRLCRDNLFWFRLWKRHGHTGPYQASQNYRQMIVAEYHGSDIWEQLATLTDLSSDDTDRVQLRFFPGHREMIYQDYLSGLQVQKLISEFTPLTRHAVQFRIIDAPTNGELDNLVAYLGGDDVDGDAPEQSIPAPSLKSLLPETQEYLKYNLRDDLLDGDYWESDVGMVYPPIYIFTFPDH